MSPIGNLTLGGVVAGVLIVILLLAAPIPIGLVFWARISAKKGKITLKTARMLYVIALLLFILLVIWVDRSVIHLGGWGAAPHGSYWNQATQQRVYY